MSIKTEMLHRDLHTAANSLAVAIGYFADRDDLTDVERGAVLAAKGAVDQVFSLCWRRGYEAQKAAQSSVATPTT